MKKDLNIEERICNEKEMTIGLMQFGRTTSLAEISRSKAEQMKAVEEIRQRFSVAEYATTG